jgi:hypothetical protein
MAENRIERALGDDYLSRDPSTSKRAAFIAILPGYKYDVMTWQYLAPHGA